MTPMVDVQVAGTRKRIRIRAILDTGFEGQVCLPIELAVPLGLELSGRMQYQLADGSLKRDLLFKGNAFFLGKKRRAVISLTEGDALVGTELLSDCRLLIDFPKEKVRLARSKK